MAAPAGDRRACRRLAHRAADVRPRPAPGPPVAARSHPRSRGDTAADLRSRCAPTDRRSSSNFVSTLDGVVAFDTRGHTGGREVSGGFTPDRFLMGLLRAHRRRGPRRRRHGPLAADRHVWTPRARPSAHRRRRMRPGGGGSGLPQPQPTTVIVSASGRHRSGAPGPARRRRAGRDPDHRRRGGAAPAERASRPRSRSSPPAMANASRRRDRRGPGRRATSTSSCARAAPRLLGGLIGAGARRRAVPDDRPADRGPGSDHPRLVARRRSRLRDRRRAVGRAGLGDALDRPPVPALPHHRATRRPRGPT